MKTIWNKETGEARSVESVDAREILNASPDLYTDVNPKGDADDPDGDGRPGGPQNVANVENEFRREPVGDDVPARGREGTIIRNPVTDQPLMAPRDGGDIGKAHGVTDDEIDGMTVAEMKEYAEERNIDLGDATLKADIAKKLKKA